MNEITAAQLPGLTATVSWSAFALAIVFGAVAQRTNFCTMASAKADHNTVAVSPGNWAAVISFMASKCFGRAS